MPLPHGNSRDANEPEIVEALLKAGCSVDRVDTPCDLIVGHYEHGVRDIAVLRGALRLIANGHTVAPEGEPLAGYLAQEIALDALQRDACHSVGVTTLIEVKRPPGPQGGTSHSKPTPEQMEFAGRHKGRYGVARSIEDALRLVGKIPSAIFSKGCR